jgi:cytochrome c oxidase cbb3-type subunit III
MNGSWSAWVITLVVINLGVTLFLFIWGLRVKIPTLPDGTSGHVWAHGVLREGIRNLPTWWIVFSAMWLIIGIGYLALYPGFGAFKGFLGWTSHDELARAQAKNDELEITLHARLRDKTVEALALDPEALRVGETLFVDNCAVCHGRTARGNLAVGAPDLTDHDWLYGGDGQSILTSIREGRKGAMPSFAGKLPDESIVDLAHYVSSLSGQPHDSLKAFRGKQLFVNCAPCHGADARGNKAMGAPNLTDTVALYGRNLNDIVQTIRQGRTGLMPGWRDRLGDDGSALVAAWVYAQSHQTSSGKP